MSDSFDSIRQLETSISDNDMRRYLDMGCNGVHESLLRAHRIVDKVKDLLEAGTPGKVVLELIRMMETELPEKKSQP